MAQKGIVNVTKTGDPEEQGTLNLENCESPKDFGRKIDVCPQNKVAKKSIRRSQILQLKEEAIHTSNMNTLHKNTHTLNH